MVWGRMAYAYPSPSKDIMIDFERLQATLIDVGDVEENPLLSEKRKTVSIELIPPQTPRKLGGGLNQIIHFFDAKPIYHKNSDQYSSWKTVNYIITGNEIHVRVEITAMPMQSLMECWAGGSRLIYNRGWLAKEFPPNNLPITVGKFIRKNTPELISYHKIVTQHLQDTKPFYEERSKLTNKFIHKAIDQVVWEVFASDAAVKPASTAKFHVDEILV